MRPLNCNRSVSGPLTGVLLCAVAFMTTSAHATAPLARSVTVSYARDELSQPEAVKSLYARIRTAAWEVCEPDSPELARHLIFKNCFENAIDDAVQKVDASSLTELHRGKMQRVAAR
jgi:UrcA family protein